MAATVTVLSPATWRMSTGSLVTTAMRVARAEWMTAPMWASATETLVWVRMAAAVLAAVESRGLVRSLGEDLGAAAG